MLVAVRWRTRRLLRERAALAEAQRVHRFRRLPARASALPLAPPVAARGIARAIGALDRRRRRAKTHRRGGTGRNRENSARTNRNSSPSGDDRGLIAPWRGSPLRYTIRSRGES